MQADNFKFRITQFSKSWMFFIIILNDEKYQGSFDSVFNAFVSFSEFLESVSLNRKSEFENYSSNQELLFRYRPVSETAGEIRLSDLYYPEYGKIYLNGSVNRKHFVKDCYTELLKLYHSKEFKNYQNFVRTTDEGSWFEAYPDITLIQSDVIEGYINKV